MNEAVKLVGDNNDGWNVEVSMDGEVVVFACECRAAAEELQSQISDCSWFQIEKPQS